MKTIYKTLFEIKLLHEFYLTDSKGDSVFDFANQSDRLDFLESKFELNRATVDEDLTYEIPDSVQQQFNNYRLRLLPTYSGFKIMLEVHAELLGDGTRVFKPKIALPENLNIIIALIKKNRLFENISNLRSKKDYSSVYYFTNENFVQPRTFPFLTTDIAAFDAAAIYEQGELASFGANDTRQFYNDGTLNPWKTIKGNSFTNKADAFLVSPNLTYQFDIAENVLKADFILKDANTEIVRKASFKNNSALGSVNLNFNPTLQETPLVQLPDQEVTASSLYTLEVTLNDTIIRTHAVLFWHSDFQFKNFWGIINIKNQSPLPAFQLLDANGYLKTRKLTSGTWEPAPVFEIAMKSRLLFWRYKNDKLRKLTISTETTEFVDALNNDLVVKQPRIFSYIPSLFKAADSTYHHLPNPEYYDAISTEGKKIIVDIRVSESNMFPSAPG